MLSRELILNFHGLGPPPAEVEAAERAFWWSTASFARLLDQIVDRPADADPRVSITFDDGNESDALLALPELVSRGLTAVFFPCAGRIGEKCYLDRSMIRALLDAGMTIGSHGMHHRNWRTLDAENLDAEITDARKILQDVTGTDVMFVAIPFGAYNRSILNRLKRERWEGIYTSDGGVARSNTQLKSRQTMRTTMQEGDILNELLKPAPIGVRLNQAALKLYKSWR
jgi:peptidoglycan/xylan/chitin deacetylase (PgdA/CDA1 family)